MTAALQLSTKLSKNNLLTNEWRAESPEHHVVNFEKTVVTLDSYARLKKRSYVGKIPFGVIRQNYVVERERDAISRETLEEFYSNVLRWKEETRYLSSLHEILLNRHYQRIIGLGSVVIPLILKELRDHDGPWFSALAALTGEDPVRNEDAGYMDKMRASWIAWGEKKRYL